MGVTAKGNDYLHGRNCYLHVDYISQHAFSTLTLFEPKYSSSSNIQAPESVSLYKELFKGATLSRTRVTSPAAERGVLLDLV